MSGIDRDALEAIVRAFVAQGADYDEDDAMVASIVTEILALVRPVEPVAFTRDRVRAELLASLPADPKWVAWVDGVLDRLEATS